MFSIAARPLRSTNPSWLVGVGCAVFSETLFRISAVTAFRNSSAISIKASVLDRSISRRLWKKAAKLSGSVIGNFVYFLQKSGWTGWTLGHFCLTYVFSLLYTVQLLKSGWTLVGHSPKFDQKCPTFIDLGKVGHKVGQAPSTIFITPKRQVSKCPTCPTTFSFSEIKSESV